MKFQGKYSLWWILVVYLLLPDTIFATHLVGAELNYKYLKAETYEIRLTIYRDCRPGTVPYDQFAPVSIYDNNNTLIDRIYIKFPGAKIIDLYVDNDCIDKPSGICYEIAKYVDTVILSSRPGGYTLVYQRCCWNHTVNNIKDAVNNQTGLTVMAKIPDVSQIQINSNPVFNKLTPPYICLGNTFEFDHSASDPDGDSIVYHVFTPLSVNGSALTPPPYQEINYTPGYSLDNVMGSGEPLTIDSITGFLTAKPIAIGQYVFGIEAVEYRNGIKMGAIWRTYQLNTIECPGLTIADMKVPSLQCNSKLVNLINDSKNSMSYFWDFGDPLNPGDTSTLKDPVYQYPDTGTYKITLIAHSFDFVKCNDTIQKEITIKNNYSAEASYVDYKCSKRVSFLGDATNLSGYRNRWHWDFGDGQFSDQQNPVHVYAKAGSYDIKFKTAAKEFDSGCADSVLLNFVATDNLPDVQATANKISVYVNADSVQLEGVSHTASSYSWEPPESLNNPSVSNPVAKPKKTTTYTVTATNELGCSIKDTITIFVNPYRCGESDIFIPNAFTPNNDGENDFFRIRGEGVKELHLFIYNRWGEVVFESTNADMIHNENYGWNGTYKGKELSPGVFIYYLSAVCSGHENFIVKGNLTLLR